MQKDERSDFIDIYVLKTLNEIKQTVLSNIKLDKKREEEVDKKMSLVLKDLINSNFKNLQIDPKGNMIYTFLPIVDEKENEKVRLSLVLYYTALYYDNVELLHELLKANVSFEANFKVNLQYLDSSISSKFDKKDYIKKIKTCGQIFREFAKSLENLSEEEKEKYVLRFADLINIKYDQIINYTKKRLWVNAVANLFDKNNLDTFTDESYKSASTEQLIFIDHCCYDKYNEETCKRLNNLVQNTDYSKYLYDFDFMMKLYTDEELNQLTYDISVCLSRFSENEKMFNKIMEFVKIRPDLAYAIEHLSQEDFMKIDNYTLIEICEHTSMYRINLDYMSKVMKPKATIKRVLGVYKKRNL